MLKLFNLIRLPISSFFYFCIPALLIAFTKFFPDNVVYITSPKPNIVLAYGNWKETRQMKGCQPSPTTTGIKRTLMQHFKVVTVPEYNTTITCSKCNQPTMDSFIERVRKKRKKRRRRRPPSPSTMLLLILSRLL